MDLTKNEDVLRHILGQWDALVDSFAALLRLRSTCTNAKHIVDTLLQPGQKEIPPWLAMLHARTSGITDNEVLLKLNGCAGTQEHPVVHWKLRYITRTEIFRTLQQNYFFDDRVVRMIFHHMRAYVDDMILAVNNITHVFHEAIRLLADVCIRAMRCHIKNRDIVVQGCGMLAEIESHASLDCAFIDQQLPMLTDALYHHRSNVGTVAALLRFVFRINKSHRFFRYKSISSCSVENCDKFSAALADVMQRHMHSCAWLNIQIGVTTHYTRKACVNIACDLLGQVWQIEHDEYFASVGFARSVAALANASSLHNGGSRLTSASSAVRVLLVGRSTGCPEMLKSVKKMLLDSGLISPPKHNKNDTARPPET